MRDIVEALTEDPRLPHPERKTAYVKAVVEAGESAMIVSLADKLHNLRGYGQSVELWTEDASAFYEIILKEFGKSDSFRTRSLYSLLLQEYKKMPILN